MIKIINWIKNQKFINFLIIILTILVFSLIFSHHWQYVITDKGRELFIPQEMLNGKVPYKDILLIYFPFAYYINAFIFKIFGISINSLIYTMTFVCMIAMSVYYLIAREFLKEKTALILTILIICSCVFAPLDLFNYIVPYSYGRLYGVFGYWVCTFALIKYIKTNNIKFAYLAAISTGFVLCCKLEFLTTIIIFIIGLCFAKRLSLKEYIKIFLNLLIFPVIVLGILFAQGVTVKNIIDSIYFGFKFAKTPVITEFLSYSGMYPLDFSHKLSDIASSLYKIAKVITIGFIGLFLQNKYRLWFILPITFIIIFFFEFDWKLIQEPCIAFPFIVAIVLLLNCKKLYYNDKPLLFLVLAALILCQREFFHMSLSSYGSFSLPFILLCIFIFIIKYIPENIGAIKTEKILHFAAIVLIILYTYNLTYIRVNCNYPIHTNKGTIYTNFEKSYYITEIMRFIEKNTDKNATILVLPEGNFINFVTDRRVDTHCFIMDRLYHDTYGEEKARDNIANTKSDYIILLKLNDVYQFNRPYLYDNSATLSSKYIYKNYKIIKEIKLFNDDDIITIFKKL